MVFRMLQTVFQFVMDLSLNQLFTIEDRLSSNGLARLKGVDLAGSVQVVHPLVILQRPRNIVFKDLITRLVIYRMHKN